MFSNKKGKLLAQLNNENLDGWEREETFIAPVFVHVIMDALKHYTINVFWILYWLAMSSKVAAESYQQVDVNIDGEVARNVNVEIPNACQSALLNLSLEKESESPFEGIDFAIHRNGEPQPCGVVTTDIASMLRALTPFENKCHELTKYDVESFLTQLFADQLWSKKCKSKEKKSKKSTALKGMYGYCDRGPDRTAELMDYEDLVRVPSGSLPCRFFTREGVRVKSLQELAELAQKQKKAMSCTEGNNTCDSALVAELHLYAVPASKVFMFAPSFVGEIFDLPHVQVDNGLPVSMEVLSVNPRVFDLKNFFSKEEAMELIQEGELRPLWRSNCILSTLLSGIYCDSFEREAAGIADETKLHWIFRRSHY
jgi:hypothetical protein